MSEHQDRLSSMALTVFALNGRFLKIADQLATPAGLTATRWQVLGAVLNEPLTQAEIARRMGITRQSVQRTSSQLVEDEMVQFIPNPSHRKACCFNPRRRALMLSGKSVRNTLITQNGSKPSSVRIGWPSYRKP